MVWDDSTEMMAFRRGDMDAVVVPAEVMERVPEVRAFVLTCLEEIDNNKLTALRREEMAQCSTASKALLLHGLNYRIAQLEEVRKIVMSRAGEVKDGKKDGEKGGENGEEEQ